MENVLVQEYRADMVECAHNGHICIVNEEGAIQAYTGDPGFVAFTRSSAKPLQAIPAIRDGMAEFYGLSDEEIAIMVASHRGEPRHVEVLEQFARRVKLHEDLMVCAPSWPLDDRSKSPSAHGRRTEPVVSQLLRQALWHARLLPNGRPAFKRL